MHPVVSVRNISKSFSSAGVKVRALDEVNIEINKGEVFGLLGPNGAGKTTLISVLCGFLIPDTGTASIFGLNCTEESGKIRSKMNFVSGFNGISEMLRVGELLNFYSMAYGIPLSDENVLRVLKLTGIEKFQDRVASDLSSGLSRRFLISKALINNPQVLLLDEPTVGLDVDSAASMRSLIIQMKKEGRTILLTTHNMREAEELCDRVALIKEGKIIASGKFSDLKKRFFPYEVIEVRCAKPRVIAGLLSGRKSVVRTKESAGCIQIFLKDNKDAGAILKLIAGKGQDISGINHIEPELEDVYMKIMRGEKGA